MAAGISLALTFTLSCSGDSGGDDDSNSSSGGALLLNFTSNYVNGALRWMNTTDAALASGSLSFNNDSKVITHGGKIFVLERPLDNSTFTSNGTLNCLSPTSGSPTSYGTAELEDGSNPYDIAFIGTTGYIAQYGLNYLQVFDVTTCGLTDTIQLPNVLPGNAVTGSSQNAASIKASGNTLLVVMQRWIQYPPDTVDANREATNGVLVRINAPAKTLIDTVELNYYNPQSSVLDGNNLYIASAYDLYSSINGTVSGIEVVNIAASSTSSTPLVNGGTLGGGATSMVLGDDVLWTIVYQSWGNATVKSVSFGGAVLNTVPNVDKATCLAYDNVANKLFIGNGTVYDTTSTAPIFNPSLKAYYVTLPTPPPPSNPIDVGNSVYPTSFPPYSLAIVRW
jgi:hypothetical protein